MRTAENSAIGLDNVVIAKLLSDDTSGVTYDTPIALKGAVQCTANPNSSVETDYADNGAFFVSDNRGNLELSLELTNVAPDVLATMLGQTRQNGITIEGAQDQAPYFALGFRIWIGGTDDNGDKIYKMYWLAKGKFSVPEAGGSTKQDNISFQHVSMTAQFVSTIYNGTFGAHCRTDYDTPATTIANWFNQPVLATGADLTALTVTVTATGSGSSKKIQFAPSKASTTATTIALASAILGQTVIIIQSGSAVAGTFSTVSGNMVFTPSSAFGSGDITVTVTNGLKDVSGVGATPSTTVLS